MKNIKKNVIRLGASLFLLSGLLALPVQADDDYVRPQEVSITAPKKVIRKGQSFDLKAKTVPFHADDDYLKWSIVKGKNVVRFDDDDLYDDEAEFKALKPGTAKITCSILGTDKKSTITIRVKGPSKSKGNITRRGPKVRTALLYDDFELEVKKSRGLHDNDLKWSIEDPSVVTFDEKDLTDDEMEFRALKTGTTTIKCTNTKNKKSVTFTVNVIAGRRNDNHNHNWDDDHYDHDHDWDDDRWDHDYDWDDDRWDD